MGTLLTSDPHLIKEVCIWMIGWYYDTEECPPPPSHDTIEQMTEERVELYRRVLSTESRISVALDTFPIDNSVS